MNKIHVSLCDEKVIHPSYECRLRSKNFEKDTLWFPFKTDPNSGKIAIWEIRKFTSSPIKKPPMGVFNLENRKSKKSYEWSVDNIVILSTSTPILIEDILKELYPNDSKKFGEFKNNIANLSYWFDRNNLKSEGDNGKKLLRDITDYVLGKMISKN